MCTIYAGLYIDNRVEEVPMTKLTIDQLFGYWKILENINGSYYKCLCTSCNITERTIRKWSLTQGKTKSCGCKRVENLKQTNLNRYGVEGVQELPSVREKTVATLEEKYGVDNIGKTEEKKVKTKQTNLQKYGVEHHSQRKRKPKGIPFGSVKYGTKTK
jgi:hypothetical protein